MEVGVCKDGGRIQLRVKSSRTTGLQNYDHFTVLTMPDCFRNFDQWPFTAKTYGKGLGSWT